MSDSLSLMFPELPARDRSRELAPVLLKLEKMAADADGPVRAIRRTPARTAEFAGFPEAVDAKLRSVFAARGISKLYSHQAEAYSRIAAGENVVIVTPTASGKTLCYNLPVLDRLIA